MPRDISPKKRKELLKQSALIEKLSHGAVVKEGKKRVTLYKFRKGKTVYQKSWMPKKSYRSIVRKSRERLQFSDESRGKPLPKGFKKVSPQGTMFGFKPGRGRKAQQGTKDFVGKLKGDGLQIVARKKQKDYIIKVYTEDQKRHLMKLYDEYSWAGRLREGTP